jgi:hypothetical protein
MSAVEVWLTRKNIEILGRVVFEDESAERRQIRSLDMRGAQREVTAALKNEGYEEAGRWKPEATEGTEVLECSRLFRKEA